MSDRLRHLQRQQALLREHLAWIDAEIACETSPAPLAPPAPETASATPASSDIRPPAGTTAATTPLSIYPPQPASVSVPAPDADELIERYGAGERQNPAVIRRGCLLVFSAGLLALAAAAVLAWAAYYRE